MFDQVKSSQIDKIAHLERMVEDAEDALAFHEDLEIIVERLTKTYVVMEPITDPDTQQVSVVLTLPLVLSWLQQLLVKYSEHVHDELAELTELLWDTKSLEQETVRLATLRDAKMVDLGNSPLPFDILTPSK